MQYLPGFLAIFFFSVFFSLSCSDSSKFSSGIAEASSVTLYEGLPHQRFEATLLKTELEKNTFMKIADHPFYTEALEIKASDSEQISKILQNDEAYGFAPPLKHCGGFHPDYALAYQVKDEVFYALVCFGCNEVKLSGGGLDSTYDLEKPFITTVEEILGKYRQNRPKREY